MTRDTELIKSETARLLKSIINKKVYHVYLLMF